MSGYYNEPSSTGAEVYGLGPTNQRRSRQPDLNPSLTRKELFETDSANPDPDSYSLKVDEGAFMQRTDSALDDFLSQGQASLANLREQRAMLKSARGKALQAANTLGISKSLIHFIDRRSKQDWYLFMGMVFITVCILFYFFIYSR